MVSPRNRIILWAKSAGRCQYAGCNRELIGDLVSGHDRLNTAYIAHIVADKPDGPRGDPARSPLLADNIENLMLLCDAHHRLIDRDGLNDHPEAKLREMKAAHELRITTVIAINSDRKSHVVLFGSSIGQHDYPVSFESAKFTILPDFYPAENQAIKLDMGGVEYRDNEPHYWQLQIENLRRQFKRKITDRLNEGSISHLSIFALAPQPLLMELGRLLSDISHTEVYQLHREPQDWRWRHEREPLKFITNENDKSGNVVALKLALSATITDERIQSVLGENVPIWSISVPNPHNDLMHRRDDLSNFRIVTRKIFDRIKTRHGEEARIHIFPALPVSAAIELGRTWMPKADLPLEIYDQNRDAGGFISRHAFGKLPSNSKSSLHSIMRQQNA